jgi:peptidyl-prolyl cis-trans isomerase C
MQVAVGFFSRLHASRAVAFSFIGLIAAISLTQPASAQVLGSGGNVQVTGADIKAAVTAAPTAAARASLLAIPKNVDTQAQGIFLRRLLAQEAERDGLDKDPAVQAEVRVMRERIYSDARMEAFDKANSPPDAVLESYAQTAYKADAKRFTVGEQTRVRHILINKDGPDALDKARALLARVKAGESFEKLAADNSFDLVSATKGGDLGFFGPGTMVKEFEAAVVELKNPGDLSGIVKSEFGYHIIKLEERRPAGVLPYAEVREGLRAEARTRALRDAREQMINKMLAQFKTDPAAIEAFTQQYRK